MPAVSEKQRRAMYAAAAGKSTLGIPKKVGEEFVGKDVEPNGHAAGVMIQCPDGRMLFLRRSDKEENYPGHWDLPGGMAEEGEEPAAAAYREASEEIGRAPGEGLKPVDKTQTPGGVNYHTFRTEAQEPFVPNLNSEHDSHVWAHPDDAPSPLHPGLAATLKKLGLMAEDSAVNLNDHFAFDRASVRRVDEDGHMHVAMTPISKANICPYYGREIPEYQRLGLDPDKTYNLLRHPEELEKAASTFEGKPLLMDHTPVSADEHPKGRTVGSVGNGVQWKPPYLMAPLTIWDNEAIRGINDGSQRELSSAYRYDADMTPGKHEGKPYDGVMRNIRGNHVALVHAGRAGPDVIVGDSALKPRSLSEMFAMTKPLNMRSLFALDAEWEEGKHPRAENGQFGSGGSAGGGSSKPSKSVSELTEAAKRAKDKVNTLSRQHSRAFGSVAPGSKNPYADKLKKAQAEHKKAVAELQKAKAGAQDESAEAKRKAQGGFSEADKAAASSHVKHREEMPESAFLKPSERKYPVKEKKNGEWQYDRELLMAAARRARQQGDDSLAARADAIRKKQFGTAQDHKLKEANMARNQMSRKAVLLQGALMANLAPKLAQDARIDLAPALKGITAKNYASKIDQIQASVAKATAGKLAQDADLDDLTKLLDAFKDVDPAEDDMEPNSGAPSDMEDTEEPRGMDEEKEAALREKIPGAMDMDDSDWAELKQMIMKWLDEEEAEPEHADGEDEDLDMSDEDETKAKNDDEDLDQAEDEEEKEMVDQKAMDSAIQAAVLKERQNAREIEAAKEHVRPYVGKIAIACDSANDVYKHALTALGVDVKGVHPSAFRAILKVQPLPGRERASTVRVAQDSKEADSFAKRWPGAAAIQQA